MESLLSGAGPSFIGRGRGRGRGMRDAFQRGGGSLHHPLHHSLSLGASPSRMGVDLGLGQDELFQGISMDSGLEGLEDDSGSLQEPGLCFGIFIAFATCLSAQPVSTALVHSNCLLVRPSDCLPVCPPCWLAFLSACISICLTIRLLCQPTLVCL